MGVTHQVVSEWRKARWRAGRDGVRGAGRAEVFRDLIGRNVKSDRQGEVAFERRGLTTGGVRSRRGFADSLPLRWRRPTVRRAARLVRRPRRRRPYDGRTVRYTLDQSGPLSQILGASSGRESATFLYAHSAERLAGFSGRDSAYYVTDARGSVRGTTDARGRSTRARSYDAWGTPVRGGVFNIDSDERGERQSDLDNGRSPLTQLFGFGGERQDPRTGLVQLRARWYQPSTGRMLGRDPFAGYATRPVTQHPYAFGRDNPLRYADPSGRSAENLLKSLEASDLTSLYRDRWPSGKADGTTRASA